MSIRAVILGTGSALSKMHFGSSALLLAPGGLILLDCPDSVLHALFAASKSTGIDLDPLAIKDILISHLHGDHCNGLEAIGWKHWISRQSSHSPKPMIHATAAVAARLWERLAPAMDQNGTATLHDYFSLNLLVPGSPATIVGATIDCRETDHAIPSCGFRIEFGGAVLGWSGDTRFDPGHIDWLSSADCIVHETTESAIHTPIACLNALPPALRSKMRLIHMEDEFNPASSDIQQLTQGTVLEVAAPVRSAKT